MWAELHRHVAYDWDLQEVLLDSNRRVPRPALQGQKNYLGGASLGTAAKAGSAPRGMAVTDTLGNPLDFTLTGSAWRR